MNSIEQLQNDWTQLTEHLESEKTGWAPAFIRAVIFDCNSQTMPRQALLEAVAARPGLKGWVVFPDEVIIWNGSLPNKPQPPLSGELGNENQGVRFEYLGADTWRMTQWSLADANVGEATHIAETVIHEPAAPATSPLGYEKLWQLPAASGSTALPEPVAAVFTGFKEAGQ